jgi:hypothetical protein
LYVIIFIVFLLDINNNYYYDSTAPAQVDLGKNEKELRQNQADYQRGGNRHTARNKYILDLSFIRRKTGE